MGKRGRQPSENSQWARVQRILADFQWHGFPELHEQTHIFRIAAVIDCLKKKGWDIESKQMEDDCGCTGKHFAEYRLIRPEPQQVTIPLVTTYTV
jgi:hypothetical protein